MIVLEWFYWYWIFGMIAMPVALHMSNGAEWRQSLGRLSSQLTYARYRGWWALWATFCGIQMLICAFLALFWPLSILMAIADPKGRPDD